MSLPFRTCTVGLVQTCAVGVSLLVSSAAFAAKADCDAIAKAMLAVPDQPSVRQTMTPGGPKSILLQDAMYIQPDGSGRWIKMPIDGKARRAMAEEALKTLPFIECKALPAETLGDVAVAAFGFTQVNPLTPGEKGAARILIGAADGLPRRLELPDGSAMVFEYGGFEAPTP